MGETFFGLFRRAMTALAEAGNWVNKWLLLPSSVTF
jgi:hypothetical protein